MSNNTILKSNKISVEIRDNDYRYIRATAPIKKGELLLIEHCYLSTTLYEQVDCVKHSSTLFNNLYPRTKMWDEKLIDTKEHLNLAAEKVQKNVFNINDNNYLIGFELSNFNHSTKPNAYVKFSSNISLSLGFVYVITNQDIDMGGEITISYGNGYFGENAEVIDYSNVITSADILFRKIIIQYVQKPICLDMIVKHRSMLCGLYYNLEDDVIITTERFLESYSINDIVNFLCALETDSKRLLNILFK